MAQKRKKKKLTKEEVHKPKRKFLLMFVCIFVAIVLIFGVVLGIVSSMKRAKAAVSYRDEIMDKEVASFFATLYKYEYMSALRKAGAYPEDTYAFWNKDSGNGKSYGEMLVEGTRGYMAQILVTNYLYDKYAELTSAERELISEAAENTLNDKAGGSKGKFNEEASIFGFSYSAFREATEMLYKAAMAESVFCGENGENMQSQTELVKEYISEYSHVKLLFIRTDKTYVLDEDGNRVTLDGGSYQMRELSEKEKEERALLIEEIDSLIAAIGTGEMAMSKDTFDYYVSEYDEGDPNMHSSGYYFHPDADFSIAYDENFEEITDKVYATSVGGFSKAEEDFGVCYIYKYEPTSADIEVDALKNCFADFYTNLAGEFFAETLAELMDEVEYSDIFDEVDVLDLPYNYDFIPVFG